MVALYSPVNPPKPNTHITDMAKSMGVSNFREPRHKVPSQLKKKMDEGILIRRVKNINVFPSKGLMPVVYMW